MILQGLKAVIPGTKDDEALNKAKSLLEKMKELASKLLGKKEE